MVLFSDFDKSKYLNSEKAKELGMPMHVTIKAIVPEQVRDPKKGEMTPRLVARFDELNGEDQGLILNKTNLRVLKDKFGNDPKGCIGKRVTLYLVETAMGEGVRIKLAEPRQQKRIAGNGNITTGPQPATGAAAKDPDDPIDDLHRGEDPRNPA
jgi:hypothetical protein